MGREGQGGEALPTGGLRALLEGLPQPLLVQRGGEVLFVSTAYAALVGWEPAELVGRPVLDLVHPDDRTYVESRVRAGPEAIARVPSQPHRMLHRDGRGLPVEVVVVPIALDGELASLALVHDLAERKRLEAMLVAADRFANLGRVGASIGHELSNPLTYLAGTLEQMEAELDLLEASAPGAPLRRLRKQLARASEGAERLREVVQDMKRFARASGDEEPRPVDLHRALDLAAAMAKPVVRGRARITRRYGDVPLVRASEARLGQVFLNLIVNAAEAAEAKVEIALVTRTEGDEVIAEVCDDGPGIAPDVAARLFEPFFTTKAGSGGTGLGLWICREILASLGGRIAACGNEGGRGACFRVALPASKARRSGAVAPAERGAGAGLRLLVVDADARLAHLIARILDRHDVVVSSDVPDALRRLEETARFDVVVCDLPLASPIVEHLRARGAGAEQRMVLLDGGGRDAEARRSVEVHAPIVVEKPFTSAELESAVERARAGGA